MEETETGTVVPCPRCRSEIRIPGSFCPECGADLALESHRPSSGTGVPWLPLLLLLVVAGLTVLGVARFRAVGPGPDTATTLRWVALGDGARRPTLATLQRAYETSRAVARMTLEENRIPPGGELDWEAVAERSNLRWRGFTPLIMSAAAASRAQEGRLGWMLGVDGLDGWGRPWTVSLAPLASAPAQLGSGALGAGSPLPPDRPLALLTLRSAGPDGRTGSADDIVFEAVFLGPSALLGDLRVLAAREREIERARVWVRWEGTAYDLVDSRTLAEWYLDQQGG